MQWIYVVRMKVPACIVAGRHLESFFKETVQVTSGNDTSGHFCDHDINSLHELCQIFTKINLTTEKRLKYVAMFSIFASNPNWQLFWRTKSKLPKNVGYSPKFIVRHYELWASWILSIFGNPLNMNEFKHGTIKW